MADKSVDLHASDNLKPSTFELDILHTAKGGSIVAIGRLFNYLSRFAITLVLARSLGAEQYGLYNLALSAATIAGVLAMFGLDQALTRYIAISRSRHDQSGLWGAIQVGVGASLLFSLITSAGLYALAYPLAEQVFHEPRLAPLLQLAAVIAPFLTLSNVLAGATRGFKNMRDTVLAENFLQPIVRFILIVVIAFIGLDVFKAVLIYGIADFSASILLVFLLNKHFSLRRPLGTTKQSALSIMGFSLPLWLSIS
jgi:O-antigen/teichoic acid export membrane protein